MRSSIEELRAKRGELTQELLRHQAAARSSTAGVGTKERIVNLHAGIENLDLEIEALEQEPARRERIADLSSRAGNTESGDGASGGSYGDRGDRPRPLFGAGEAETKNAGLRTIERHVNSGELRSDAADRLDAVIRRGDPAGNTARYLEAVADPDYLSAFGKVLAHPHEAAAKMTRAEQAALQKVEHVRALSVGVGASGGFAVPFTLDPSIIATSSGETNPVRAVARVETIGTDEWQGVSSDGITAAYGAEASEATDDSPTLVQPTIKPERGRAFVPFSIEVGMDWGSLQAELTELIADARDRLDAQKFLDGSGTNEPFGVLTGLTTTQRVLSAGTAVYAVADPWSLKAAIPSRFSVNTTFAADPAVWDTTFRFVGGNSAEPLQFDAGRGGGFLGRPKIEWSTMSTATTTTGAKILIGGDFFAGYRIIDRIGMTVELIPHLFGANRRPSGERGLFAYWRTGAKVVAANALRYLEVK